MTGAGKVCFQVSVPAFDPAGHLFSRRLQVFLPTRQPLNLYQDVQAHEFQDLYSQVSFAVLHG